MKSIISNKKECWFCGSSYNIHKHHIYFGANRKISEKNGFWVNLCAEHHNMSPQSVHLNREMDLTLKTFCQEVYEKTHTREEFRELIGKSYL